MAGDLKPALTETPVPGALGTSKPLESVRFPACERTQEFRVKRVDSHQGGCRVWVVGHCAAAAMRRGEAVGFLQFHFQEIFPKSR